MNYLISLLLLFVFLIAGVLAARVEGIRKSRVLELLSKIILPVLLLVMGYRIGISTGSGSVLARTGIISLVFAFSTAAGTFLFTGILCLVHRRKSVLLTEKSRRKASGNSGSLLLFAMVLLGFCIGFFLPYKTFDAVVFTDWLLRFLLFSIGVDLAKSGISFIKTLAEPATVLLPLMTLAGSLIGGLAAARILDMNPWKGLAVASGFGWYSLSGVLITNFGDPLLGSAAFLTNMLRETIALILIPFLGPTLFGRSGIGIAGATSMDVTLPVIERSCGPEKVPLSIFHGVFLSLLVPFLVPFFFHAG